ncbi:hypothetical protein JVT61DRAFT_10379 [Boletus reticuloceps]|uniref:Uncharacterized protein n=1 Tax=Boletus reticuloceps TaxID=495285 RepID=A0A8I3AC16_9AGAM|nr:hypothetical protein JVT61DRAFT_10379 [Boletus reticuloceps]
MATAETTNGQLSDNSIVCLPSFMTANLAALLNSGFAQGHSNNKHQAAARVLLRHDVHLDGTHYQICAPGGLHPSFIGFNPAPLPEEMAQLNCKLVDASIKDLFNAVGYNLLSTPIRLTLRLRSPFKII